VYYIGVFKFNGYGCQTNYEHAINWFERAAALDDPRVSHDAEKAAEELKLKMEDARRQNDAVLDRFSKMADVYD